MTEIQKVAEWNAQYPVGTEVEIIIGQHKINHKATTKTGAYENNEHKAAIRLQIADICEGEFLLELIKPITEEK